MTWDGAGREGKGKGREREESGCSPKLQFLAPPLGGSSGSSIGSDKGRKHYRFYREQLRLLFSSEFFKSR